MDSLIRALIIDGPLKGGHANVPEAAPNGWVCTVVARDGHAHAYQIARHRGIEDRFLVHTGDDLPIVFAEAG